MTERHGTQPGIPRLLLLIAVAAVLVGVGTFSSDAGLGQEPRGGEAIGKQGEVTLRLIVSRTRVPADGRPIKAQLVLTNLSGAPLHVANGCEGLFAVGIASSTVPFRPAFADVGCLSAVGLPSGKTRFSVTISTTYGECLEQGGQARASVPRCIGPGRNQAPPLPPGRYVTKVEGPAPLLFGLTVPPIGITLVPT